MLAQRVCRYRTVVRSGNDAVITVDQKFDGVSLGSWTVDSVEDGDAELKRREGSDQAV